MRVARTLAAAMMALALPLGILTVQAPAAQAASRPTITVNDRTVTTGQKVTLTGRISTKAKKTVTVQVRYTGTKKWVTVKKVTARNKRWSLTLTMGDSRDRTYRAVWRKASKTISVRVDPRVEKKTVSLAFNRVQAQDPALDRCTSKVTQTGVPGTRLDTYTDGALTSQQVISQPVDEITTIGTSSRPCVTKLAPGQVASGAQMAITGKALDTTTKVTIGGQDATISSATDERVTATVPQLSAGDWPVTVISPAGSVDAGTVTVVVPPEISSISANSGSLSGGQTVTISGVGLSAVTQVIFTANLPSSDMSADGSKLGPPIASRSIQHAGDSQLKVLIPAGLGGANTVTVTSPYGTVTTSYTYTLTARDGTDFEQLVLAELNKRRTAGATCYTSTGQAVVKAAVPALTWDGKLSDLALSHSKDVVDRWDGYVNAYGGFSHVTLGLSAAWNVRVALAYGSYGQVSEIAADIGTTGHATAADAAGLVDGWMASTKGHCTSIMSATDTTIGIGVADAGDHWIVTANKR